MRIAKKLITIRARYWRLKRLIYMSPAEARFIELMGGKIYRHSRLKSKNNGFPVTIVLSSGQHLKSERFKREVRYGQYFVDFANDVDRIIEIDGSQFHMDVVADMDREIYIKELCRQLGGTARIMRIPGHKIWRDPDRVQRDVLKFIYS